MECGGCGKWGERYIPGNASKHSGELRQTSSNIPGNVFKYSRDCNQTFCRISSNIPGTPPNILWMLPIFGVKEDNYWAESYLEFYLFINHFI